MVQYKTDSDIILSKYNLFNRISDVRVSECGRRGFEPRSGQIKDYEIGIYCFSAKHAALRKSADWNQDNVYEWSDMSLRGLLFQWGSTSSVMI